jgi:hypothetical protein
MKDDGSDLTTELNATLKDVNTASYPNGRAGAFEAHGSRQAAAQEIIDAMGADNMVGSP